MAANNCHDPYKVDCYKPYVAHMADNPNCTDDACATFQMNKDIVIWKSVEDHEMALQDI